MPVAMAHALLYMRAFGAAPPVHFIGGAKEGGHVSFHLISPTSLLGARQGRWGGPFPPAQLPCSGRRGRRSPRCRCKPSSGSASGGEGTAIALGVNILDPTEALQPERRWSGEGASTSGSELTRLVVSERLGDTLVRRYVVAESGVRVEEGQLASIQGGNDEATGVLRLPRLVREFFLPAGFPESVSRDYLEYMLWQFPVNVTGWTCSTLVTSTLLKAVGIGAGPESAAAAAAAIKWVTKDGIGAVGRLFVGGRFGSLFDEDPKQWRMCADLIGSAGSLFELATPLWPSSFLLLASLGNLTKAVAKGLKDPSARVIQDHLAASGNVGDIVAKEEVWAVMAQLVGLGIGVLILKDVEQAGSYWTLLEAWLAIRTFHLFLRFYSLNRLRLESINYKRAAILIRAHTQGLPVLGVDECNKRENLLMPRRLMRPTIVFGCSLADLLGPSLDPALINQLAEMYASEDYMLVFDKSGGRHRACIALKGSASSTTLLKGMYQSYLLHSMEEEEKVAAAAHESYGGAEALDALRSTLVQTQASFGAFLQALEDSSWKLSNVVLKPPSRSHILTLERVRDYDVVN